MATEESLELEIEASAKKANAALDSLIKKLGSVSSALGGVDTEALGNFAKNLGSIAKNGGIKDAEKAVSNVDKAVKNLGKTKAKINVDTKTGMAAISELQKKFADVGKDAKFSGSTSEMQKEYDKLSEKLDKLSEKEQKALATGNASTGKNAFVSMQYDIADTLNKMDVLSAKIKSVSSANGGLGDKFKIIRTDYSPKEKATPTINTENATKAVETVKKSIESIPEAARYSVEKSQQSLMEALAAVHKAEDGVSRYDKAISDAKSNLASVEKSGKGMGTSEWDGAYIALQKVTDEAKRYKAALNQKSAGVTSDIKETDSLDAKVEKLRANLKKMKSAGIGFGNAGFDKSYIELVKAESELKKYKSTLNQTGKDAGTFQSRIITAFSNVGKNIKASSASIGAFFSKIKSGFSSQNKLSSGFSGIASKLSKLVVGITAAKGAFSGLKSAMDYSSDLTEVQNVVDTSFGKYKGKIEDLAKTSIQDYGMSELTAKQIAGRFQAMGTAVGFSQKKMSGMSTELTKLSADMASFYNVNQEDVAKSMQSVFTGTTMPLRKYGIDLTQATLQEWAHKQGIDANIKSMSQAEKTMLRYQYVMSQTGAAQGDFARTANTWANQTRMLQQNFQNLGSTIGQIAINAFKPFVKAMNSTLVKLNGFAKQARDALGKIFGWEYEEGGGVTQAYSDAADGADDTADATKKAAKAQKEFNKQLQGFDKLNNLTSSKDKDSDDGGTSIGELENIGAGSGGKWKQKDSIFKKFESDIDTLEKLGKKISDTLSSAMESIDWQSIYQKAAGFGSGIASFLNGLITPRLFGDLGKTLAGALNTALTGINSFATTFDWKNLGDSIASGINGFFKEWDPKLTADTFNNTVKGILTALTSAITGTDWEVIAEKIGEAIKGIDAKGIGEDFGKLVNSMVNALYTLVSKKDTWKDLGTKIGDGINGFFKEWDPKLTADTFNNTVKGILTALTSAITGTDWEVIAEKIGEAIKGIDAKGIGEDFGKLVNSMVNALYTLVSKKDTWKDLGTKIGDGINGFFKGFGKSGWKKLGKTISNTFSGFLTTITTALETIDWDEVGQSIGDFLSGIEFGKVVMDLAKLAKALAKSIGSAIKGSMETAPIETAIILVLGTLKFTGLDKKIFKALAKKMMEKIAAAVGAETATKTAIAKAIGGGIGTAFKAVPTLLTTDTSLLGAATAAEIGATIFTAVVAGIAAAFVGFHLGQEIGKLIMSDDQKKYAYHLNFSDIFKWNSEDWADFWQAFADWWVDVEDWWSDKALKLKVGFSATKEKVVGWWSNVKDWWGDKTLSIKSKFDTVKSKVSGWWSNVKDWWGDKAVSVKSTFDTVKSKVSGWWSNVKNWWGDKALKIKSIFSMDTLKSGINTLIGWINTKIIDNLNKISLKLPKALGGKTIGFDINHIATFETGGTPKLGQLFYARENGKPELVGRQGRQTKVINNDQIITSTSKGVADAVYNVMTPVLTSLVVAINQMNSGNGQTLRVEGVSDGDIVRITTDANNDFKKRTGRPLYA